MFTSIHRLFCAFLIGRFLERNPKANGRIRRRGEGWGREEWGGKSGGIRRFDNKGRHVDEGLLKHVALVDWNHINLTGDYFWRQNKRVEKGGFRPLRFPPKP